MSPEGQIYNDGRLRADATAEGDLVYVRLEGRFDPRKSEALMRAFAPLKGEIALELHELSPIETPFIMFLKGLQKRLGGRLRLVNPPPRLLELLELAGAGAQFKTIDITSEAAKAVRQSRVKIERVKELEKALTSAREIVRCFFPRLPPKLGPCQTAFVYLPCDMVGGDFFGFVELPDERYGIFIGDVAGHGVEAAVLVGMVKKVLEIWAKVLVDPIRVLTRANEDLSTDVPSGRFVTAIYGVLDTRSGIFEFARAGHNLPIIAQAGRPPSTVEARGLGLCISHSTPFRNSLEKVTVRLEPDTVLLLYTDGLVEAENNRKEEFGVRRVMDALAASEPSAPAAVRTVMNSLYTFRGGTVFDDDITAIALSMRPQQQSGQTTQGEV